MKAVNLYEAKTQLSKLTAAAIAGEDIVIAKNGKPLVRLVPVQVRKRSDAFGTDRGAVTIAPDFDETPADFKDYTA
ncbi:MAG: type II toxin-antitoxin system Phd/YefM family antitoxin [Candidatus Baltobacteraceae bacterium]